MQYDKKYNVLRTMYNVLVSLPCIRHDKHTTPGWNYALRLLRNDVKLSPVEAARWIAIRVVHGRSTISATA